MFREDSLIGRDNVLLYVRIWLLKKKKYVRIWV